MIKVEIKSMQLTRREVVSKSGRVFVFQEQEAWAHTFGPDDTPHPYPQRITLNIDTDKGERAYEPGMYLLSPGSIYVNRFASLMIGRARLRPYQQPARAAAAA